ncbi:MAG: aminopeptidase, partial [Planctomycetales bacterium]|nr:aminopeptidase [Planctomycetales bacterium]
MNSRFATWAWIACFLVGAVTQSSTQAQVLNSKYGQRDEFRQLEEILPTPNTYRTASGAPGTSYWQQRANYIIDVRLDDDKQEIHGSEKITYQNHSPDELSYLWLQLDVNQLSPTSDGAMSTEAPPLNRISTETLESILLRQSFDGSLKITEVKDSQNKDMKYTIVKTMMRIDLDKPLPPGETISFSVAWNYRIVDATLIRTRSGYEFFEKDGNYIYEMAHWYPRMVAYTDYTGWQHKQFLGNGEFTLELGDYMVRITAPEDHIVGATGVLLNDTEVLSDEQRQRLESAKSAKTPVFIVTPDEAKENQKEATDKTKTWIFKADNVRDFAWASSRKFIWDAQQHDVEGNQVMAMSYYPNEAEPLWSKYSTHSIIHTLN